jgi:glyoxylate reductase
VDSLPRACIAVDCPDDIRSSLAESCSPAYMLTAEVGASIADAEGLVCPAPFPITRELLDSAPRLRVVSNFGVGFNNVDLAEMNRRGIAVCNTPGVLSDAVADLTMGMIFMASRGLAECHTFVHGGAWSRGEPLPPLGWDLAGKTLGLIGFGRIGRAVARRARAFGMNIIHHDVLAAADPEYDYVGPHALDSLLANSDVVSLHVNLTPETHHLISSRELNLMKPTGWILNTARGPVIDQSALVQALRSKQIAGAVLDVLEVEPPAADDPILSLDNAILLPHIGSATVETRAAMLDLAVQNLKAVLSGQTPPSCVNPEALERAFQRR